jgi:hypothetical protein
MDPATPSDEILDLIGAISMDRQAGAAAGNESRRKLHEFLGREREALQSHGPGGHHAANIDALVVEIGKLRSADPTAARAGYSRRNPQLAVSNAPRDFPRHNGRRTMGRSAR